MIPADFRHAITIGLGRAILWLRGNPWLPHAEAIEHVCAHNTAYDAQCEGNRAPYVYECVRLTDAPDRFASVTARALLAADEYWDAAHLFHLARLFASDGHAVAREAIYERFERNDARHPLAGAGDIIELDGTAGLLRVFDRAGRHLIDHPEYKVDDDFTDSASDADRAAVRAAAESNPNVRRYLDALEERRNRVHSTSGPSFESLSYEELRDRLAATDPLRTGGALRSWARKAPALALIQAAADLLRLSDSDPLLRPYLWLFASRPFPLDPDRLLELAQSENWPVARDATSVLEKVTHPSIRSAAMERLARGSRDFDALRFLVKNPGAGDQSLIEDILDRPTDEDALETAAHAAADYFEANRGPDPTPSMLKVYERCRCSLARTSAVKILLDRRTIPAPILEECCFDSYDDTRELARKYQAGAVTT